MQSSQAHRHQNGDMGHYNGASSKNETEYQKTLEVGKAPDTFPCGHVLCHNCIRKHLKSREAELKCPVCDKAVEINVPIHGTAVAYDDDDDNNVMLVSNFDDIVRKFNGINYNLRRLKEESVQSRSVGMTFSSSACHMCEEDHGTLRVIQEFNKLSVNHQRPPVRPDHYFYRLCHGQIVTSFYSKVNSACVCVPCTYKNLQATQNFPELKYDADDCSVTNRQLCLAEVGKLIVRNQTPLTCMQGKNVIDVDHKIKVTERADEFDFHQTSRQIKRLIKQQEKNLIQLASKRVRDTGRLYYIQESSSVEHNPNETVV